MGYRGPSRKNEKNEGQGEDDLGEDRLLVVAQPQVLVGERRERAQQQADEHRAEEDVEEAAEGEHDGVEPLRHGRT